MQRATAWCHLPLGDRERPAALAAWAQMRGEHISVHNNIKPRSFANSQLSLHLALASARNFTIWACRCFSKALAFPRTQVHPVSSSTVLEMFLLHGNTVFSLSRRNCSFHTRKEVEKLIGWRPPPTVLFSTRHVNLAGKFSSDTSCRIRPPGCLCAGVAC